MTLPAPTYDLVLLLDPQAEEDVRAKLVADARKAIEAQGEFLRHDEWGNRAMTYPIDRKTHAEYHLLQFHAASPELLSGLDRTLRIADDVLRFRIIKLAPGVPAAPDMATALAPAPSTEAESPAAEERPAESDAPAAPVAEPASVEDAPAAEGAGAGDVEIAVGEPSS
jgi:small subunit ribosomal protein S6